MKKLIFLVMLFAVSACETCQVSESKRQEAEEAYHDFGTFIEKGISEQRKREMFGCLYRSGDDVFAYSTLWGKKYILVRNGEPITVYDRGSSLF
jgi:hypothetical protein